MKCKFTVRTLTQIIVLYVYFCYIHGKKNAINDNSNEAKNLMRKKYSSNYFWLPSDSLKHDNKLKIYNFLESEEIPNGSLPPPDSVVNYKSVDKNDKNKKPNHMMKVVDLSKLKNTNTRTKNKGKKDPKAEEKVDPYKKDKPIATRNPGLVIGDRATGISEDHKLSMPDCGNIENDLAQRIVNGKDAPEGAHPWIVAILRNGDAWCGGSILNENWIITAAHCFMGEQTGVSYAIRVGTINRNEGTTYKVEKVITHQRFNLDNMLNSDIAMLKTSKPIKFGKLVKAICLPTYAYEEPENPNLVVAGWGQTSFEDPDLPVMLQDVDLKVITDGECSRKYRKKKYIIYRSQICTWNYKQDACQGDSGGPATEKVENKVTLIGIVSYGSTCADDFPGVYTQVSYFINWMSTTIKNNS